MASGINNTCYSEHSVNQCHVYYPNGKNNGVKQVWQRQSRDSLVRGPQHLWNGKACIRVLTHDWPWWVPTKSGPKREKWQTCQEGVGNHSSPMHELNEGYPIWYGQTECYYGTYHYTGKQKNYCGANQFVFEFWFQLHHVDSQYVCSI